MTARANHKNLLDKRTELISKCHHKNKYILKNYQITVKSIKKLCSNYAIICSNGILSEMCIQYLTYCKPHECVNMKLIVACLC